MLVNLIAIKFSHKMPCVTDSLQVFVQYKLTSFIATVAAGTYLLVLLAAPFEVYSTIYPQAFVDYSQYQDTVLK
jgi:hypothetical protein